MFRSSPPEVFSKKDAAQIRSKPTGEQPRRSAISKARSHPHTDAPPRIQSTPAEHLSLGDHLWETARVCQNSFKKYKL